VAECDYRGRRLIVRRTRLTDTAQARLWLDWRHFGFLTDLAGDAVALDAFHRHHAVVELAIRDLKEGAGLDHVPSGHFFPNGAWLCCAVLAHNLIAWTATLGQPLSPRGPMVAGTVRRHLIAVPGRLVNRSGVPTRAALGVGPGAQLFTRSLARLRDLQPVRSDRLSRWAGALAITTDPGADSSISLDGGSHAGRFEHREPLPPDTAPASRKSSCRSGLDVDRWMEADLSCRCKPTTTT
jgi:hypothetical protein